MPGSSHRLEGVDLARFVALAGMVVVHARTDLVLLPLERASGQVDAVAPPSSELLELVQSILTNRARLLFLMLAGVSAALLHRRQGATTSVWCRRAAFLTALGLALAAMGWSDLVLVFYGALFLVAPLLLRAPNRLLAALAIVSAWPAVVRFGLEPGRDDTLTNVLQILGEVLPLFCVGVVVGRLELDSPRVARRLGRWGLALAAPGLVVLASRRALDVTEVAGGLELAAALTSSAGLCLVTLCSCLWLVRRARRPAGLLASAGAMPLTGYVGHAILFTWLSRSGGLPLDEAMLVALTYLLVFVAAAAWWRRVLGTGPVEAAMRRVSGPR